MIGAVCKALLLRTLARHPQGPAFSLEHHLTWVWWCTPRLPEWRQSLGERQLKAIVKLHKEVPG